MNGTRTKQYRREYIEIFGGGPTQQEWRMWKRLRKKTRKPTLTQKDIDYYKEMYRKMNEQRKQNLPPVGEMAGTGDITFLKPSWWDRLKKWIRNIVKSTK